MVRRKKTERYERPESVWYCGSFCGCDLKKVVLQKVLLVEVGLIFIYVWLKL